MTSRNNISIKICNRTKYPKRTYSWTANFFQLVRGVIYGINIQYMMTRLFSYM